MAEYKSRKLFQLGAYTDSDAPESYESMWAYSVRYPHAEYSTPGRYRIRITRMTAAEFVVMMGGDASDVGPDDGFSIQGHVEKWTDRGWLHCLDWIGDPESTSKEIEQDLNEMFQAFTTGVPTEKNWDTTIPPRPPPKDKDAKKPPKFTVLDGNKKDPPKKAKSAKDDDPSFDWI